MDGSVNILNWFEISVSDIARAKKFYGEIFSIEMQETEMMGMKMAFFPAGDMNGKVSGGLVQGPYHKPSADGAKIYFNANLDMDAIIAKIEPAGGKITMPKTDIGEGIGFMAFFTDSEGNGVALHSSK
ncbi:VOC family protein [soil metagenome]|jgi:predicted enzyme related to lactoylglutathione lyase